MVKELLIFGAFEATVFGESPVIFSRGVIDGGCENSVGVNT